MNIVEKTAKALRSINCEPDLFLCFGEYSKDSILGVKIIYSNDYLNIGYDFVHPHNIILIPIFFDFNKGNEIINKFLKSFDDCI